MDKVSKNLDINIKQMEELFGNDKTIKKRVFMPKGQDILRCTLYFCDGLVLSSFITEGIIKPILRLKFPAPNQADMATFLEQRVIQSNEIAQNDSYDSLLQALLYGDTILFIDGSAKALIIGTKGFKTRGIEAPQNEPIIKGPREGFIEPILHNLGMIRRKLRTKALKFEYFFEGDNTRTTCCLCYIDGVMDEKVLKILRQRLKKIKLDGIFDSNYIGEFISDGHYSPFKSVGTTERPDVVAAKLLEGRAAILVDGSPVAITVPHILLEDFQSGEDYYVSFQFAAINRVLRMAGFLFSISVLPLYVALVTFHQEMLPTRLLLSISAARQGVPFPSLIEAILLLVAFEVLREAGARAGPVIGQTLSIVGGLVVGQAAVEARIVSSTMLIVVAFSGITGLIVPKLKGATIILRLGLLVLSAMIGFYGYFFGMLWIIILLSTQKSFGISLISSIPTQGGSKEDSVARPPFPGMKKHGRFISRGMLMLAFSLLFLTLGGCADLRESDTLTVAAGIGIDGGSGLTVTVEAAIPDQNDRQQQALILQKTGDNLLELTADIAGGFGKRIYYPHTQIVAFGSNIAKSGIKKYVEALQNSRDFPLHMRLVICENNAQDVFGGENNANTVESYKLCNAITRGIWQGTELYSACNSRENHEKSMALPLVAKENGETRIIGTALFENDKMVATLNMEQSKYLALACGINQDYTIAVNGNSFTVQRCSTKIKRNGENAAFTVKLGLKAENEGSVANDKIAESIKAVLAELQRIGCDPFGIFESKEDFQSADLGVTVQTSILTRGRGDA